MKYPDRKACAVCRRQSKKCTENCELAPYFPAEKIREFKVACEVFGVSNIKKIVKNLKEDDRRKAVESLIWGAFCRQKDPILGPYEEYKRVYEELKLYKSQYQQIPQVPISQGSNSNNNAMVYEAAQGLTYGWNINRRNDNLLSIKENSIVEYWSSYNNNHIHHVQTIETLRTENSTGSTVIVPQQHQAYNEFNQQFNLAGQYNTSDANPRESML